MAIKLKDFTNAIKKSVNESPTMERIGKGIRGYYGIKTAIGRQKLIENIARRNVNKKYRGAGQGALQEMFINEVKRLKDELKKRKQ